MNPAYSAWFSGEHSGCTLCHYAHAQGKAILTTNELVVADKNFREWFAVGYGPIVATAAAGGVVNAGPLLYNAAGVTCLSSALCAALLGAGVTTTIRPDSNSIGRNGVNRVLQTLNDPNALTEQRVAGIGLTGRIDILTNGAMHEVKTVTNLSLSQRFTEQAERYAQIAQASGLELHYWLMNDAPRHVVIWLERLGITVHQ